MAQQCFYNCDLLPFKGYTCVFAPEIHPSAVQQLLRVSLVGVLHWLVSGHVVSHDGSSDYGLQTGQRKGDSLGGQWWLLVLFYSFKRHLKILYLFYKVHVLLQVIFFDNIKFFLQRLKTSSQPAEDLPVMTKEIASLSAPLHVHDEGQNGNV